MYPSFQGYCPSQKLELVSAGNLVVQYILHCKNPVVREKRKDMIMCTVVKTPKWFDILV